jgi:hypothetical protein
MFVYVASLAIGNACATYHAIDIIEQTHLFTHAARTQASRSFTYSIIQYDCLRCRVPTTTSADHDQVPTTTSGAHRTILLSATISSPQLRRPTRCRSRSSRFVFVRRRSPTIIHACMVCLQRLLLYVCVTPCVLLPSHRGRCMPRSMHIAQTSNIHMSSNMSSNRHRTDIEQPNRHRTYLSNLHTDQLFGRTGTGPLRMVAVSRIDKEIDYAWVGRRVAHTVAMYVESRLNVANAAHRIVVVLLLIMFLSVLVLFYIIFIFVDQRTWQPGV